jgi:glycosyltransferase involved in cell wall biosynthesis
MDSILLVTDPVDDSFSVQYEFIISLGKILKNQFDVYVFSTYFPEKKARDLETMGIKVIRGRNNFKINALLKPFGKKNESMLWIESWFREAFLKKNTKEIQDLVKFDYTVNLSTTIPVKSNLWWIQGRSFYFTLKDLEMTSRLVRFGLLLFGGSIRRRDKLLLEKISQCSKKMVTNAKYLALFYSGLGYSIDDVIYTAKNFDKFNPSENSKKDYVLTYIGKETDFQPIIEMSKRGIKIKGFGTKVPIGISLSDIKKHIDYLGYVSDSDLSNLYSNALFTAFPFIEEPFGYIPIESMACGTPVLAYNKQGPAETIIDEKTGWLISSDKEFVERALKIWKNGHQLRKEDCIERAKAFTSEKTAEKLLNVLKKS